MYCTAIKGLDACENSESSASQSETLSLLDGGDISLAGSPPVLGSEPSQVADLLEDVDEVV